MRRYVGIRTHGAYAFARVAPAVLSLLLVAVLTRTLAPNAYGLYAVLVVIAQLVNGLVFQWVRSAAARFVPSAVDERLIGALRALLLGFVLTTATTSALAIVAMLAFGLQALHVLAVVLLGVGMALFEFLLELDRATIRPGRYAARSLVRATIGTAFAATVATLGGRGDWAVLGLAGGFVLAAIVVPSPLPSTLRSMHTRDSLGPYLRYGLPLSAIFAFSYVINSSDRLMLTVMEDIGAAGRYAAAYDVARQPVYLLTLSASLAMYPLVVKFFDRHDYGEARRALRQNFLLILAIGLPAAIGLIWIAPDVVRVLLGDAFRAEAVPIVRLTALAALLAGIREHHASRAFQLRSAPLGLLPPLAAGAALNVVLNYVLIRAMGPVGAAWSTVASFGLVVVWTWLAANRRLATPLPVRGTLGIVLATGLMSVALAPMNGLVGVGWLFAKVAVGALAYLAGLGLFGGRNVRDALRRPRG